MTKPPHWPDDVEPMAVEEFEKLGINAKNELFWDGRPIELRRSIVLTTPQRFIAFLAILATLATIATGFNNATVFLCGRGIQWLSCPVVAAIPVGR
jgi:hypothetical protein